MLGRGERHETLRYSKEMTLTCKNRPSRSNRRIRKKCVKEGTESNENHWNERGCPCEKRRNLKSKERNEARSQSVSVDVEGFAGQFVNKGIFVPRGRRPVNGSREDNCIGKKETEEGQVTLERHKK